MRIEFDTEKITDREIMGLQRLLTYIYRERRDADEFKKTLESKDPFKNSGINNLKPFPREERAEKDKEIYHKVDCGPDRTVVGKFVLVNGEEKFQITDPNPDVEKRENEKRHPSAIIEHDPHMKPWMTEEEMEKSMKELDKNAFWNKEKEKENAS